nr:DUF86 domain-containing protein [Verrucomicrobium sp. 3C]
MPQGAREVFPLLAQGGWIETALADRLKRMVGFRNVAVHDYQSLQIPIVVRILTSHLEDFLEFSQSLLLRDAAKSEPSAQSPPNSTGNRS